VTVKQKLPPYPGKVAKPLTGMLEFVVNEEGVVESQTMRVSVDSMYDKLALSAARSWQYQAATVDGKPVKFLKRLSISLSPTPVQ
jgi:TonB family protein